MCELHLCVERCQVTILLACFVYWNFLLFLVSLVRNTASIGLSLLKRIFFAGMKATHNF